MKPYLLASLVLASTAAASGAATFAEDAGRATSLRQQWNGGIANQSLQVHWFDGDNKLWYEREKADGGREVVVVDTATAARETVASADGLPRHPSPHKPNQWPAAKGQPARSIGAAYGSRPSPISADKASELEVRDHHLFLKSPETRLSSEADAENSFQAAGFWSPDGRHVVAMRIRPAQKHPVYMVESAPKDQLQPKLHSHDYLKPGDQIRQESPHLFDLESRSEIPLDRSLFADPWSIQQPHWSADGSEFRFVYNQRGHQALRVIGIDAKTGKARAIIDEISATFIDYSQKHYVRFLPETDEILWTSERDGWHHLYLYDASSGELKNQITRGEWIVRSIASVDTDSRVITFQAMGIFPGQDPYHIHFARINFDGTGLVHLTDGDGTHDVLLSPEGEFLIDSYSRVDLPPVHELRRTSDGNKVCELERADTSRLAAAGWRGPQRFVAKGRDGTTDIHGILIRPSNFDAAQRYPVIEKIYAGPHGHFVPKKFSAFHHAQTIAEHGFILVQIDGMGTNFRSKAFHDVCWKNLMDSGFPDRIAWLRAAASQHPELDLGRVGIFGGSAGGQSTLAGMLNFPEFYKVGVADCGCHDNRMDKIWWNEAWMGTLGDHYAANSNVTNAHQLRGKLLLTVGELDRNVDPASTMQVVDALIKADRDFDMIIVPGAGHGIGEAPYLARRRIQYFIDHLK